MDRKAELPDNNPKSAYGVKKPPLHLIPPSAKVELAAAMGDGARKYGPFNWRENAVSASIYKAAAERHLDAFWDGEDIDPASGAHHLGHAMACCAIILDALATGNLLDDRPLPGAAGEMHRAYAGRSPAREAPDSGRSSNPWDAVEAALIAAGIDPSDVITLTPAATAARSGSGGKAMPDPSAPGCLKQG